MRAFRYISLRPYFCNVCIVLAAALILTKPAQAALPEISTSVQPRSGTIEDTFVLKVEINGSAHGLKGPQFKPSDKFQLGSAGTTVGHYYVNGQVSSKKTFTFRVLPEPTLSPGSYNLPQGYFESGGQIIPFKLPNINIVKKTSSQRNNQAGAKLIQFVDKHKPYVGEQVLYTIKFTSSARITDAELSNSEIPGFWRESYGNASQNAQSFESSGLQVITLQEALFAAQSGELSLTPRTLTAALQVPTRHRNNRFLGPFANRFPSMFDLHVFNDVVTKRFVAKSIVIDAKPLPEPPVANLKYIPVGKVKLTSSVDKILIKSNESATMTLKLYGDANLRPYELSNLDDKNFKIYSDKPKIETFLEAERISFEKVFKIALVPKTTGKLLLPQVQVVVFNSTLHKYEILRTPVQHLIVDRAEESEKLVVTGQTDTSTKEQSSQSKQDIEVISEDLLPQHVGASLTSDGKQISGSFLWMFVLLTPLASLGVCVFAQRQMRLSSNPKLIAKKKAFGNAQERIKELAILPAENRLDTAASVLKNYLGDKFLCRAESLTPTEAQRLICSQLEDETLAKRVQEYLAKLEGARFGGRNGQGNLSTNDKIINEAKAIIDEVEKSI